MKKNKEKDQIDLIPYIEHSFLSIDRKEDLRQIPDFAFFFFLGILPIQGSLPQAPPHTTSWGAVRPLNKTK